MALFCRIGNLFRRNRIHSDIDAELQAHIAMRTDDNVASGMSAEQARRNALVRFGNTTSTRENIAATDVALGLDRFLFDIRYAWRKLANSPGFTATAAVTIALGIGANTAIFSCMDAVVVRPLAVPRLDRVVVLSEQDSSGPRQVALGNYEDWKRQNNSFEDMAIRTSNDMSLTGAGDAAHVEAALTSASFFSILRTQAVIGRVFDQSECRPGSDGVAVLGYSFWQQRFASGPDVIGRHLRLDDRDYTVIGVMPRAVQYPSEADVFLPLAPTPQQLNDRQGRNYLVTARLRDSVTVEQAQAEMRTIGEGLAAAYPATNLGMSTRVEPLLDGINGDLTPLYYKLVMCATLFVLLVVCANIANLQFSRSVERRPEIAMRSALGATRWRLMRQLVVENILLGLIGAMGGLVLGELCLRLTLISMPQSVARHMAGWSNISLNGRAFVFSVALALFAGLVSGFMPALEALRFNLSDQIKAGSRSAIGSGRSRRIRNIFAVAQISLAVALVIGAALMAKGMESLLHFGDVYQPAKVLTFNIDLPARRYDTPQKRTAWYAASLEKLRVLPGVAHAEITTSLPYSDEIWQNDVEIENRPTMPGKIQSAQRIAVSEGYFSSLKIPIVEGRAFTANDTLETTPVAVVSRSLADRYFAGGNPIGHRIRLRRPEPRTPWLTIVGVAEETSYGLWDQSRPAAVYMSVRQVPLDSATYAVMAEGDPLALAIPARKALAALDPSLPMDGEMTWTRRLHENLVGLIYVAAMLGVDALIALFLAALGIFGVMSGLVGERTREMGVRLAMGARREDILSLMLRSASWLIGAGLVTGLALAFALARGVANLLPGIRPDDPVTFIAITVSIAAIAFWSSWIPARRAARIDPIRALRSE
jgi:putative ABC transport system permease protein